MTRFATKRLAATPDTVAPDASDVRVLLGLERGSMAHFALGPGRTSRAVFHHALEEIWFFVSGRGEMWRKLGGQEEVVRVESGVCISLPPGTHFQFRTLGSEPLAAVGVTMPPWPGEHAATFVEGPWRAS